ncbi:efflux RND transporter periplasmic adaptor subunit [Roseateles puraquae]|uniref:Efflux transporter periplasmic adaptor subunit n=1 Tax=Roseateles puraquae TaxID=431059 RepID=A0A254N619_9BURK|nr:efflux RND transporter periplasmic adaptor subunit [Roseateles puraquae]MDG0854042.1 efflux RND transporter periplasmic adaptor subunit [Roseateles puraquae]OWR03506.1 efflux transporter periplasmic adaptor subunit [Roseateles puraquae]
MKTRLPSLPTVLTAAALTLALAAACVLALSGPATAQAPAASAGPKPALTVKQVLAQSSTWPQTLSATGSIAAWQEVIIGAEIGGQRLAELKVDVGDRVKKGQLLARLSPGTLETDLAASKAALLEAEASAREARQTAERVKTLQGSDALSPQAIDQALAADAAAQARVAAARARVQADQLRLAYTQITAPDDGVVNARLATPGALVQPGQELFRLQRQGRLEWRAEVPGPELARLKAGQLVRLAPSGAPAVEGRVRRVSPQIDTQTRNGLVYVDLKAGEALRAGLFARGDFVLGESPALTLPQTAVLLRDGFSYVFRIDGSKVRQTKVQVGRREADRVEIRSGLSAGAAVVESGVGFLADGDTVQVQK